jgi:cell division transport system permease protein
MIAVKPKSHRLSWLVKWLTCHEQAFRSSLHQLSLSPFATFMTFAVIGITLALPFGLFVLLQNIQVVSYSLHDAAQISVYLKNDIEQATLNDLESRLKKDHDIIHFDYISPQEGLQQFEQDTQFSHAFDELTHNPLPGVFIIEPNQKLRSSTQLQPLLNRLQQLPNIGQVQLDMLWLQRLNAILLITHRIFYALALLFAVAVILIIGNTIRLTTQNHRDEILIIKLLGGSNAFVRRPFLYSGVLYGFAGGIIAWLLIDIALWGLLQSPVNQLAALYHTAFQLKGMSLPVTLILLMISAILGSIGSWLAVGRYIRAIESN